MNPSIRKVFPSSHPHLNIGNLGLPKNPKTRVSVLKVLPTSLNPKEINNEAMEDI
jgi:hypothetical protein